MLYGEFKDWDYDWFPKFLTKTQWCKTEVFIILLHFSLFFLFIRQEFLFWDRVSLNSSSWPGTYLLPASAFTVLGLCVYHHIHLWMIFVWFSEYRVRAWNPFYFQRKCPFPTWAHTVSGRWRQSRPWALYDAGTSSHVSGSAWWYALRTQSTAILSCNGITFLVGLGHLTVLPHTVSTSTAVNEKPKVSIVTPTYRDVNMFWDAKSSHLKLLSVSQLTWALSHSRGFGIYFQGTWEPVWSTNARHCYWVSLSVCLLLRSLCCMLTPTQGQ